MAKGFTPLIDLAVVVALALAAVFGSMSLANPAQAQATTDGSTMGYQGVSWEFDANPLFAGIGTNETITSTTQVPDAIVTVTAIADMAGKFTIHRAADVGAGVPYLDTVVTFSKATTPNATTKTVAVRVMDSRLAVRAQTTADTPADVVIPENMRIAYVSAENSLDFSGHYVDGTGAGEIVGYMATVPDGTTYAVVDKVTAGEGHESLQAGPDGMVYLMGGDATDTTGADLSVTPMCYFGAGVSGDELEVQACESAIDSAFSAVVTAVTVVAGSSVMAKDDTDIPDRTGDMSIDAGDTETVDLLDEMGNHLYFDLGTGQGATVTYSVRSEDEGVVRARVRESTGVISLLARNIFETVEVTVTATDAGGGTAMKSFLVAVTEPGAPPMPGVVEMQEAPQSLMAMPSMAAGATVPTIGRVTVMWEAPASLPDGKMVAAYEIRSAQQTEWSRIALDDPLLTEANGTYSIDLVKLEAGAVHNIQIRAVYDDDDPATMDVDESTMGPIATYTLLVPAAPTFVPDDVEPGKNSWYTLQYSINKVFNGGADTMTIKLEGFGVPSSISTHSIAIVATEPASYSNFDADPESKNYNSIEEITFNPASIAVDGKEITMTFPDVRPEGDITKKSFDAGTNFKVIIYQSAGVSNPTASRVYGGNGSNGAARGSANADREIFVAFSGVNVPAKMWLSESATSMAGVEIPRVVILSEDEGGLGEMVMVEGLGFENGGTMHFFLDSQPDGRLNAGEDVLCSVPAVSGNAGNCQFEITTPTFSSGLNYVNAVDGDGKMATEAKGGDNELTLKASIKATPAGGSPGEIMQVQLVSFTNRTITAVKLSGNYICGDDTPDLGTSYDSDETCAAVLGNVGIGTQGTASISVTVPNWAIAGSQELVVEAGDEDDDVKVVIVGPRIVPTPQTVVANQRVSLVGTGFSPRSEIGEVADGELQISRMSIGGDRIDWERINNGRDIDVDDGGNWSASVDLPLSEATTGTGNRLIRITDSEGRTGSVEVTLAERNFDITPPEGRVGTLAVVRGVGYPSKNDEGTSFTVDVVYQVQEGTSTRVSVVPDASGRFEVQVRIPTTAAIPSTNQVEVKFKLADGTEVLENKQHVVPEGIINLSETSGGPGSIITISGEGYKAFVNVDAVSIGTFDVTPAPKPHTDGNGMMSFDILVPGIDVGIQTIEVHVGGTTSSVGFTVTESGVNPGDIVAVAKGIEDLGDNLVSVWNFNNDSKVWSFYDPTLAQGNTLTHMITGETYLIRIKANQEVILNRDTRSLTCVGGNCWNQVVW
ncbi:MAG: hypothetical protein OXR67_06590 [Chloroflexota bacterium]|nr:hypothetical protein [Chloroflexota bacterium]